MRTAVVLAALLGAACHPIAPTYSDIESKVLLLSCAVASCHSTKGNAGGLDLSQGKGYASLVGVDPLNEKARAGGMKRVVPGDTAKSFLLLKIAAEKPDAHYGERMPNIGDPLDEDARWAITQWVADGAKNE